MSARDKLKKEEGSGGNELEVPCQMWENEPPSSWVLTRRNVFLSLTDRPRFILFRKLQLPPLSFPRLP